MKEDQIMLLVIALWVLPGLLYGLFTGMLFESLFIAPALGIFAPFLLHSMRKAKTRRLSEEKEAKTYQENARRAAKNREAEQQARQREAEAQRSAQEEKQRQEESKRKTEENKRDKSHRQHANDERYYGSVLGLRGAITRDDVKRRYRELVAQYHPDKVNHLGPKLRAVAEQEMKEINSAYEFFRRTYGI